MNDKIYMKPSKPTSRSQQIKARLALLGDELVRLEEEKISVLADIVTLKTELGGI